MSETSYSSGAAARRLGISIPTLKRKCDAGEIPYFLTPGGHRRIPADAVERLLGNAPTPAARGPSGGLQREDCQGELGSAGQELRTRREAEGLRVEPTEEEEKLMAQARWRELQRNTDSEAARLTSDRAQRQAAQERELEEARCRSGVFQRRWHSAAADLLPAWLSFEQHEEALVAIDRVIARCSESEQDGGRMPWVLNDAIARLLAPWEKERQVEMRRQQVLQSAIWSLSGSASASEKARATAAIRQALADLPLTALDHEERAAAEEAVRGVNEKVKARLAAEEKERAEKEAQARKAREDQQRVFDEQQRKRRKDDLVRRGVDIVWWCLWGLKNDGAISEEEYEDIDQDSLKRAVGKLLQSEITGDETDHDLEVLVEEIVADELDLESVEDESDKEEE
jgi:excisionase family DNA binding protein